MIQSSIVLNGFHIFLQRAFSSSRLHASVVGSVNHVIREVDEQLGEAAFGRSVIAENR